MLRITMFCVVGLSAVLICGTLPAEEKSGPEAGVEVPALKVEAVAGAISGEEKDFAADRAEKPTIYYFIRSDAWDRPVGRLLSTLDERLAKEKPEAQIFAVFLSDDVAATRDYLPRAQQSLKLSQTVWSVYPGEKSGPAEWNINARSNVTVVVANDKKILGSAGYGSVNETLAREILHHLDKKE
jgi:hypothetical protein